MNIVFDCPLCTRWGGKLVSINIGTNHPPPSLNCQLTMASGRHPPGHTRQVWCLHFLFKVELPCFAIRLWGFIVRATCEGWILQEKYWYVAWHILLGFAFVSSIWRCAKLFYHRLVMSIVQVGLLPDSFKAGESWSEPCERLALCIVLSITLCNSICKESVGVMVGRFVPATV